MQLVTEIALPHVPLNTPEFNRDPISHIRAARQQHPWLANSDLGYFIHGYEATSDLAHRDDMLRPSMDDIVDFYGLRGTEWGRFMQEHLMAYTNPKHDRIRASVSYAFTPRNINRHRELMRDAMTQLLDEWAPLGQFDFADFASYFPIAVLCGLLGTSTDDIPAIRDAMESQVEFTSLNPTIAPKLIEAHDILWNFCDRLIREREQSGVDENSVLDQLIAARNRGEIDDRELRHLLMILFPAGYDTSKNMLTMTVHVLMKHPEHWSRCAGDPSFCDNVVQEMFRYSGVGTLFRTVAEDLEYQGVLFPKGTNLIFGISLTGRDPAMIPDADTFDPDRAQDHRHFGFGRGVHLCLGQFLARAQIAEGLHQICRRISVPRLTGEVTWRPYVGIWGPSSLPIAFEVSNAQRA